MARTTIRCRARDAGVSTDTYCATWEPDAALDEYACRRMWAAMLALTLADARGGNGDLAHAARLALLAEPETIVVRNRLGQAVGMERRHPPCWVAFELLGIDRDTVLRRIGLLARAA